MSKEDSDAKADIANPEQNEPYFDSGANEDLVELDSAATNRSSTDGSEMDLVPYGDEPEPSHSDLKFVS